MNHDTPERLDTVPEPDTNPGTPSGRRPTARRPILVGAAILVGGLGAAACGGAASLASSPPRTANLARPGTVQVRNVPGVGPVLVDSAGRTLYLLSADRQEAATCTASPQCAAAWPPLDLAPTSSPVAGSGIHSPLLSTIMAANGARQVTYNRWPLYTFTGDHGPGQARGQGIHGFGGVWSAVSASGQPATTTAPAPMGPSSSGNGGY
jgi:predicted lipoprotein with Yx(FWY)xxD motif